MRQLFAGMCAVALFGGGGLVFAQDASLFEKLDADKDGYITADEVKTDEQKAHFERLLKNADKDGDKKLSKEEFQSGLKRSDTPRPAEAGRDTPRPRLPDSARPDGARPDAQMAVEMFNKLDANSDGKLTEDEVPEGQREGFRRLLANLDDDGDKAVTKDQAPRVIMLLMQRGGPGPDFRPDLRMAEQRFNELDANKDGKLTVEEVPPPQREVFEQILQRADDDGDKAITKEQFPRLFMAMMVQRGRPPFGPGTGAVPPLAVIRVLDANADGELSKEEIENASKSLATLDKNADGSLSREELFPGAAAGFPGRPAEGRPDQPRTEGRPDQPRREGQPDRPRGEGRPADRPAEGRPGADQFRARLKEMDTNSDGKISKDEAQGRLKEGFDRIDANSDGVLDEAEIRALFQRGDGRRPEGRRPEGREGDRPEGRRRPAAEGDDKPKDEAKDEDSRKDKE